MITTSYEITLRTRLVVSPVMVLREEDEGANAILYDPRSGAVRILNRPAATVWRLLDGRRTVADVVEALQHDFKGMDTASSDQVLRLCQRLHSIGAIGTISGITS